MAAFVDGFLDALEEIDRYIFPLPKKNGFDKFARDRQAMQNRKNLFHLLKRLFKVDRVVYPIPG